MLAKIPRKDTRTVVAALAKHIRKLPEELRRSLTWDQGKEMHAHKRLTVATNVCPPSALVGQIRQIEEGSVSGSS
jgi:IS30 family transposase